MSNNMDNQTQISFLSLTDISQIACLSKKLSHKEVTMAQSNKKRAISINIKYSSTTGELVIDGELVGVFSDESGRHPTTEEMSGFIRVLQQRLPFENAIVDNITGRRFE